MRAPEAEGEEMSTTTERFIEEFWKRVDSQLNEGRRETIRDVVDKEIRKIVWAGQAMRQNFFGRCGKMNSIKEWDALIGSRDRAINEKLQREGKL
jgi:hypothetical protein